MTISTIVLAITDVFGGGGETGGSPPKNEGILKKWLYRLANALKRLAGKAAEALPAIVGSVVGGILSFLGKTVGFVAKHTWALIVFVAGLVGWWLMQKVKKSLVFSSACFIKFFVFFSRFSFLNILLRYLVSHNATYDKSKLPFPPFSRLSNFYSPSKDQKKKKKRTSSLTPSKRGPL